MNILEVGKPYTGPIPPQDGLVFEIGPDGDMQLLIQFQNPSREEKEALLAGFRQYSLYTEQHPGKLLIACWVFKFSAPVSYMDAPFHAGLYQDGRVQKFLDTEQNMLQVIFLDGEIVQGIRIVGLHPAAMEALKETVGKQSKIERSAYDACVDLLYQQTSRDIFNRGLQFSHRETKQ